MTARPSNIAGDYIAHGVRERASEIVTLELGRQTEQEVSRSLEREVDAERFTRLDRMLIVEQQSRNEFADLRPDRDMLDTLRENRALLIQRARTLERMGLATEVEVGRWTISSRAAPVLRELGERGDIIKTLHRVLEREGLAEARPVARDVLHRIDADQWRVPADLVERGQAYDFVRDRANVRISVLSPTGLAQQIGHEGATWLDRELAARERTIPVDEGFGRDVKVALERRKRSLVEMGHATDLGDARIRAPKTSFGGLKPPTSTVPAGRSLSSAGGNGSRPFPVTMSVAGLWARPSSPAAASP